MKKSLSIATLVVAAATGTAAADSTDSSIDQSVQSRSPGYVSVNGTVGLESIGYLGLALDGGLRLGNSPVYAHAQVESGVAAQVFTDGTYQSYRLGLEARGCDRRIRGCAFGGVDAGLRRARLQDTEQSMEERISDVMVVPRIGLEFGTRLKARVALDLPVVMRREDALMGAGVSAGVGFAF